VNCEGVKKLVWKKYLKKVGPGSRKRTFFFGTVYLIMHMSLNWDQVTYTTKYAKMLLHSELSLKFLQGSSCPTRWPRFKWVLGGVPACWAILLGKYPFYMWNWN
jgi:hypothetical protein